MIEYENLHKLNQRFAADYHERLGEVLSAGQFILGKQVREFENQFANYCGAKYCVGVGNGTDALTLALRSFSFPKGSEVIVAANTYIASVMAIVNANLIPVMVDSDLKTYTIDVSKIEESITKRTVAIMAVHLYGKCCGMDSIRSIADKFQIKIIEDCAQAHGAHINGKKAGTFGDIAAFSFYPTKNLGALGDAGALITSSDDHSKKIRMLGNYGSEKKYFNEILGSNSRLDELQAAFLSVKLKSLDLINDHKRKLAAIYSNTLKQDFIKPVIQTGYFDVHHIYNVRHQKRDKLREYLLKSQIGTEIHYPVPPYKQKALSDLFDRREYPVSDEIHETTLSLPISWIHSEDDIRKVVKVMNEF